MVLSLFEPLKFYCIRTGIHQILVRIANTVDPDQKQSDLGLHCLSDKRQTVQTWIRLMEHTHSDLTEQSDLGLQTHISAGNRGKLIEI